MQVVLPVLVDPQLGLTLRAPAESDVDALVEVSADPETVRFTDDAVPYGPEQVRAVTDEPAPTTASPRDGDPSFSWVLEAERDEQRRCCGSIALRPIGPGTAGIWFALHPGARGRGLATAAVRLVRDYALDVCSYAVLRWASVAGNWPARRVAAAAGFRFDGVIRRLLTRRNVPTDGWVATLTADDARADLRWTKPPLLDGEHVVLRAMWDTDVDRIVEACQDPRTQHWLASLPSPYGPDEARAYLEGTREDAASGSAWSWCVADRGDGRCLGAVSIDGFGGYHRRNEIGYWAHPDARGRGVTSEAVRLVTTHALGELGRDGLIIRCAADNHASRHVAEAAGYRVVGPLLAAEPLGDGSVSDLIIYARP